MFHSVFRWTNIPAVAFLDDPRRSTGEEILQTLLSKQMYKQNQDQYLPDLFQ